MNRLHANLSRNLVPLAVILKDIFSFCPHCDDDVQPCLNNSVYQCVVLRRCISPRSVAIAALTPLRCIIPEYQNAAITSPSMR